MKSEGRGGHLVVLGGGFVFFQGMELEQKEQTIWKVLGDSEREQVVGELVTQVESKGRGEILDQWNMEG